jgi:CubicO group peptidase (beta-lactamase class C family)
MHNSQAGGVTRRAFSAGAIFGAMAAPVIARAQGVGMTVNSHAAAVLESLREEFPIPALSAAVVKDGELVWAEANGMADLENGVPASPQHLFRLGSVSKVVTAAIGARLLDQGVIDLDAPISTYRPDLPEAHKATTLRQLYSHMGGVRHYNANDLSPFSPTGSIDTKIFLSTDEALAIFINDDLVAEPGTSVNYSTFGYTLISAVLESASGASFTDLIRREVSAPLGLETLGPEDPFNIIPNRVGFYDPPAMYLQLIPQVPLPDIPAINSLPSTPTYKYAGGGMHGTAVDVARFGAAQLAGDYVSEAARAALFTPRPPDNERALGLGWRIDRHDMLGQRYHHAGNMQGCRAQLALYPEHGLSVALMSNMGATPGPILNYTDRIAAAFIA